MVMDRQAAIEALLDRFERASHRGIPSDSGARRGHAENPVCGDVVEAWIAVDRGRISAARFEGHGCTISQALADAACEALEGLSVEDAHVTGLEAVLRIAGAGLVDKRPECADVGLAALKAALSQQPFA